MKHRTHRAHSAQRGYLLLPVILILSLLATTAYLLSNDSALHNAGARSEAANSEARYTAEAGLNHALWQVQQANCSGYPSLSNQMFGKHSYSTSVSPTGGSPISLSASAQLANGARYSISRTMVDTYELPLTQTLVLGTDPGGDVMLDQFYKNSNYGRLYLQVSGNPAWMRRTLLQFDLGALPTGIRLLSAELQLYQTSSGSGLDTIKAHAITRSWTEGTGAGTGNPDGATWNTYNGALAWTAAGGDYKAEIAASAQTRVTAGWISWDLSALATRWLDGTQANQGVVLLSSGLETPQFAAKENATATLRPRLVLTYACPCDAGAAGNTLSLQPDAASGQDTYLDDKDPAINWGAETSMRISNKLNSQKRGLLRFDLSSIPTEAIVTSASLALNLEGIGSGNTGTLDLHRVTRDWNPSQANWTSASSGDNWSSAGGDYDATPLASVAIDAAAPGLTQWDITAQVTDWVSGNSVNQGLMLKTSFDVNHADFSSSNHATPALRPTLSINYQCPCGAVCTPLAASCDAFFTASAIESEFSTAGQAYRYNTGITPVPAGLSLNGISVPAGGGWVAVGGSGRLVLLDRSGSIIDDSFTTGLSGLEGIAYIQEGDQAGKFVVVRGMTLYLVDPTLSPPSSYQTHTVAFASELSGATYISGGSHDRHLAFIDKVSSTLHITDQAFNLLASVALEKRPGAAPSYSPAFEGIAHLPDSDNFLIVDVSLAAAHFYSDLGTWLGGYPLAGFGISKPSAAAIDPLSCAHVIGSHPDDRYWLLSGKADGDDGAQDTVLITTADTRIQAGDSVNRGTENTLIVGMDNGSNSQSALLWFDVTSLPAGAIIDSAALRLNATQRSGNSSWTLSVHRSGESWTETGATWLNRSSGTAWSQGPGGTYDASAVVSAPAADAGAYAFNITPLVQEWVDGVSVNHGLQLVSNAPKRNWLTFESREGTQKPEIIIRYSLP